jgi:hypothetical protein
MNITTANRNPKSNLKNSKLPPILNEARLIQANKDLIRNSCLPRNSAKMAEKMKRGRAERTKRKGNRARRSRVVRKAKSGHSKRREEC